MSYFGVNGSDFNLSNGSSSVSLISHIFLFMSVAFFVVAYIILCLILCLSVCFLSPCVSLS